MRNIITLALNDLAVSFKNKSVYLMVFIPLFIFLSLTLVDQPDGRAATSKLGVIRGQGYVEPIIPSLEGSGNLFSVTWLSDEADGRKQLTDKSIDGVLLPAEKIGQSAVLLVLKKESIKTLFMLEGLSELQRAAEARTSVGWVSDVIALEKTAGIQNQTLPIWVLMIILLVGFLVVPPQVAEEKEKKILLGLLQTPMTELEWLLAKVLMGMCLSIGSISLLHLVSGFGVPNLPSYFTILVAGTFCFSSLGVLLGFLCRTQASARALGVVVYLPHLLPSALADFSGKLNAFAVFVPSYQFFVPAKAMLLDGATSGKFVVQLACLIIVGLLSCAAALVLLRKRWLM